VIVLSFQRYKNRALATILTRFPALSRRFIEAYQPWESEDIPWASVEKPLHESTVVIVTTSGVHHIDQEPFDMGDPFGDPSYRELKGAWAIDELRITHDYYDHSDADKDINIVFPIQRLKELAGEGVIGQVAETHYGLMGHIDGHHIPTLVQETGPEVASKCKSQRADIVLFTPG